MKPKPSKVDWDNLNRNMRGLLNVARSQSRVGSEQAALFIAKRDIEEVYALDLAKVIKSRLRDCLFGLRVYIRPLINHVNYSAMNLVDVSWQNQCGKFFLTGKVGNEAELEVFINRCKATAKLNPENGDRILNPGMESPRVSYKEEA